jgi:hypothetical protein
MTYAADDTPPTDVHIEFADGRVRVRTGASVAEATSWRELCETATATAGFGLDRPTAVSVIGSPSERAEVLNSLTLTEARVASIDEQELDDRFADLEKPFDLGDSVAGDSWGWVRDSVGWSLVPLDTATSGTVVCDAGCVVAWGPNARVFGQCCYLVRDIAVVEELSDEERCISVQVCNEARDVVVRIFDDFYWGDPFCPVCSAAAEALEGEAALEDVWVLATDEFADLVSVAIEKVLRPCAQHRDDKDIVIELSEDDNEWSWSGDAWVPLT